MKNLSKMESFEGFQVSKQAMSQITGARSKSFGKDYDINGNEIGCYKTIDTNDGVITKTKFKDRYDGMC